jgi:hypothetical protein
MLLADGTKASFHELMARAPAGDPVVALPGQEAHSDHHFRGLEWSVVRHTLPYASGPSTQTIYRMVSVHYVWPALLALAAAGLARLLQRRTIRRQRLRAGLCVECAYNLTGNTSGVCPECGSRISA